MKISLFSKNGLSSVVYFKIDCFHPGIYFSLYLHLISVREGKMNFGGSSASNNLETLLEAAKYIEEQEMQLQKRNFDDAFVEESPTVSDVFLPTPQELTPTEANGAHCVLGASPSFATGTPPQQPHSSQSSSRLVTREVHNNLEKKRRAQLKECFDLLKKQVPISPEEKKVSNLSILHGAIKYIQILRRKDREYEHELERLAREKIAAQQRLSTLKRDLTAQWDHIDFNTLLPNSIEYESRRRSESDIEIDMVEDEEEEEEEEEASYDLQKSVPMFKCSTAYSSPSSLSSASPQLQTVCSPMPAAHLAGDLIPHRVQIVQGTVTGVPGMKVVGDFSSITSAASPPPTVPSPQPPPSHHLLLSSGSTIQLLPSTTLRVIPERKIIQSSITIPNGVIGHGSGSGTLPAKRSNPDTIPIVKSGGTARMMNHHSIVVTQPRGQVLLPIANPRQLSGKVVGPILKPVKPVSLLNAHQLLVKPTVVVVSSPSTTTTNKLC